MPQRSPEAEHGAADVLRVILVETGLGSGSSGSISAGTEAKAATGQSYSVLQRSTEVIHTKCPKKHRNTS